MNEKFVLKLENHATIIEEIEKPEAVDYLEANRIDALIWIDTAGTHIELLEKNSKSAAALEAIQDTNQALQPSQNEPIIDYVYETSGDNQLDSLADVFFGVISFFFVFILSGMSFVRERFGQTLERMLMTPISRIDVIGGYILGYGLLAAFQSVVVSLVRCLCVAASGGRISGLMYAGNDFDGVFGGFRWGAGVDLCKQ